VSRWPLVPLRELADIVTGVPTPTKGKRVPPDASEYSLVSVGSLAETGIADREVLPVISLALSDAEQNRAVLKPGDVLLTAQGAAPRSALVRAVHAGCVANHTLLILRPLEDVRGATLYAALRLPWMVQQLERLARTSTATRAWRPSDVGSLSIHVPPGSVQEMVEDLVETAERHHASAVRAMEIRQTIVWGMLDQVLRARAAE
jgi:hypothetical protein